MKRITVFFFVFFLPVILFFISCRSDHYRITSISIYSVEKVGKSDYIEVNDDIINVISIQIVENNEKVSEAKLLKNFAQPLYAAVEPPEDIFDNRVLFEKTELLLDKDIYYKGEVIEKGTDLRSHPEIKELCPIVYIPNYSSKLYGNGIEFDKEFYENVDIPEDEYTITVVCHTDDGLELKNSVTKTIKLNKE